MERIKNPIDELALKGVEIGPAETDLELLARAMGLTMHAVNLIRSARYVRPSAWVNNPEKVRREKFFASIAWKLGVGLLSGGMERLIKQQYGAYGQYDLPVAFLGGSRLFTIHKIRTMEIGANNALKSRFDRTAFSGYLKRIDTRVLPGVIPQLLRKSGIDEAPQAMDIAHGRMALIGIRGWTAQQPGLGLGEEEIDGLRDLYFFREDHRLAQLRPALDVYPELVAAIDPLPALVSPLSATSSKDARVGQRIYGDVMYMCFAQPSVDFNLFIRTIAQRLAKRVGAR